MLEKDRLVANYMAWGLNTLEIAKKMGASSKTVRRARARIREAGKSVRFPDIVSAMQTCLQSRQSVRKADTEPLGTVLVPSDSSPVSSSSPVSKRTPKNLEKRARKKTSSLVANPGHGLFVEEFFKLHEAKTGARPLFTGKHGAMVNTVLKGLPVEQAVAKLKAYYGGDWWFTTKGGHSLEGFIGHINEIPLNGSTTKYSGTEEEMRERYQTVF